MSARTHTVANARRLRKTMSLPELLLWNQLRRFAIDGLKFRRQHPFGAYVLDFYCASARLNVEVDGEAHHFGDRPERDSIRDGWLQSQGVRVLRFPASHVLHSLDGVVEAIRAEAQHLPPPGGYAACPPP